MHLENLIDKIDLINCLETDLINYGKFGVIISSIYNCIVLLPDEKQLPTIKGHEDSIKLTLMILYKKYLQLFRDMRESNKTDVPNQICFVDCEELQYAIFLASIRECVLLDSSEIGFNSGLFIIPEEYELLPINVLKTLLKIINQKNLDDNYEVALVPKISEKRPFNIQSLYSIKNRLNELIKCEKNLK